MSTEETAMTIIVRINGGIEAHVRKIKLWICGLDLSGRSIVQCWTSVRRPVG
jgi:hypothetical protein